MQPHNPARPLATPTPARPRLAALPAAETLRRTSSSELFGNGSELLIEHGDALYRLRITSLGKLILTK